LGFVAHVKASPHRGPAGGSGFCSGPGPGCGSGVKLQMFGSVTGFVVKANGGLTRRPMATGPLRPRPNTSTSASASDDINALPSPL
jgi:hypothetical protein